ncbi:T9SS type A sorting domain-containing protein [Flavobacterium psychrophilum]|nr:T9SS type A sorting domain-containing protein [Flavobacterium psychrophilum]
MNTIYKSKRIKLTIIILLFISSNSFSQCWSTLGNSANPIALGSNGTLWWWGSTSNGDIYAPTQLGNDTNWSKISSSGHYMAVKTDGSLWGWGNNSNGQIGDGTIINKTNPTQIGISTDWKQVLTGLDGYTIGLKNDGTLWAWGINTYGQLGVGTPYTYRTNPTQIGTNSDWSQIAVGANTSIAIKTNGTLWSWGKGVTGNGIYGISNTPIQIGTDNNWTKISIGIHYLALKSNNTLWSWGVNGQGQIGNGSNTIVTYPLQITSDTNWSQISATSGTGGGSSMAIKTNGTLWAWGSNFAGKLGDGTNVDKNIPVQIGFDTDWAQVSPGLDNSVALKSNGSLLTWGSNLHGQLGVGPLPLPYTFSPYSISCPTSLSNEPFNLDSSNFTTFPNPTKNFINIETKESKIQKIELYDINSKLLFVEIHNSNKVKIDISSLEKGIYFIKSFTKEGILNSRIIKI